MHSVPRCIGCGKQVSAEHVKRCRSCYDAQHRSKHPDYRRDARCSNCKKPLPNKRATLCKRCYKSTFAGKGNPNYRGSTICPTCGGGKERHSKQCMQCAYPKRAFPKCKRCGKTLSQRKPVTGYCRTCYQGSRTTRWNHDRTEDERNEIRSLNPDYLVWRTTVFERDNYACKKCGDNRGHNLTSHHIASYIDNPELRTEVTNGVTLCEDCHIEFHRRYGWGYNTREQFNEFMRFD